VLTRRGISTSYRRSHGQDIDAACGQLAVKGVAELRRRRRDQRRAARATAVAGAPPAPHR
jgi:hypothetical protein